MSQIVREFYTFEDELWYRLEDGTTEKLIESSTHVINDMIERIESFYPKAYSALCKEYDRCKANLRLYRFKIVQRFCKCNFGNIDNIADVDPSGRFNLESVPCPLRGECRYEGVICRPEFDSRLTNGELRVLKLWYDGYTCEEIAEKLYLSYHTVCNHIRRAMSRLGLHDKAEFFRYAQQHKIFEP